MIKFIFYSIFIPNNSNRYKEIKYCLQENVKNMYIDHIHLLNEKYILITNWVFNQIK